MTIMREHSPLSFGPDGDLVQYPGTYSRTARLHGQKDKNKKQKEGSHGLRFVGSL
jgi:hypothetical protein